MISGFVSVKLPGVRRFFCRDCDEKRHQRDTPGTGLENGNDLKYF